MKFSPITLGEFIIDRQNEYKNSTGEFTRLISSIKLAAKVVQQKINKAGLVDVIGNVGDINIQGEVQQKMDVFANETFINALISRGVVCGIISEENEDFIEVSPNEKELEACKYVVLMDPLDGSSNIDVNVNIGTIFSVYKRISPIGTTVNIEDFLQKGNKQVAAGYIVYGSSTMLVYTTGNGVNGFTLDPSLGVFYLSNPDIRIPEDGNIYSVNEGNYLKFPEGIKKYIKYCQEEKGERPYKSRYIGSLVSDFHRNLLKGGIYMYPSGSNAPNGKLRLLYECNPMAFIIEQAGGRAIDGNNRILDLKPEAVHQRIPFICGSKNMVDKVEYFLNKY